MGRKVKVQFEDSLVDGTEVDIVDSKERWSEYTLEDGNILRVKVNIASIAMVNGRKDPSGNAIYVASTAISIATIVPSNSGESH